MKKFLVLVSIVLVQLFFVLWGLFALAHAESASEEKIYEIVRADNLWNIAEIATGSGDRWRELYVANPHLPPIQNMKNGGKLVVILPGQQLTLPLYWGDVEEKVKETLRPMKEVEVEPVIMQVSKEEEFSILPASSTVSRNPLWLLALILPFAALAAIAATKRGREQIVDSGRAMIIFVSPSAGVPAVAGAEQGSAQERIQRIVDSSREQSGRIVGLPGCHLLVAEVIEGRGYGKIMVTSRNPRNPDEFEEHVSRLDGQTVFKSHIVFPKGFEISENIKQSFENDDEGNTWIYSLARCLNPVRNGGSSKVMAGFRFVALSELNTVDLRSATQEVTPWTPPPSLLPSLPANNLNMPDDCLGFLISRNGKVYLCTMNGTARYQELRSIVSMELVNDAGLAKNLVAIINATTASRPS
jgi:hypothetical protein